MTKIRMAQTLRKCTQLAGVDSKTYEFLYSIPSHFLILCFFFYSFYNTIISSFQVSVIISKISLLAKIRNNFMSIANIDIKKMQLLISIDNKNLQSYKTFKFCDSIYSQSDWIIQNHDWIFTKLLSSFIIFIIFQIVSLMKSTVNKFDYPTATSHNYKVYKQTKSKQSDPQTQKNKFRQFDKQQRQIERAKAQKQKEKKLEQERKQKKKKIQQQLEKKKQELIELQKMKNIAIEAEKKSYQLAMIRQQQQRIMKSQQERRAKENQFNAQNRFLQALRRLQEQKDINSKKQKEAMFRRKVIEETEKLQRDKAIKYREVVEQKEKAFQPEQKITFKDYKQPLGRTAYNKTVDYTKTYFHNPNIIIPNTDEQENALEKAQKFNNRLRQKSLERKARQQQFKKMSEERGRIAMQKITLQREYNEYAKQQEQRAKQYNYQRIQAGKKNQYAGVKPATLVQMEANKRARGQEEFEQMFFGGQNPEWFGKPSNRYHIVQNKLGDTIKTQSVQVQRNGIPCRSIGSVGAVVSDSHYSFESEPIDQLTSVKKINNQSHQKTEQKKRVIPLPKQILENNQQLILGQSGQSGQSKYKEQLSYSQSQDEEA